MKRNYFFTAGLLLMLLVVNINDASAQIVRYGLKAGIDVADHKVKSDMFNVGNRTGFQVGGVLELNVPLTGFGVETGLHYGFKDYDITDKLDDGEISNLNYLTVPIYLKKRFSLLGLAGIYVSAGVYGNIKVSGGDLKIDDVKYEQEGFQTGLGVGAGVSLLNHLELGMNYKYKFTDTYSEQAAHDFRKVGRQTWNVSLAYLF